MTAATNDVGLVTLSNGRYLAIAIFVSDSMADDATREALIAKVARTVWDEWRLKPVEQQRQEREYELSQSGCFTNLGVKDYPWSIQYSAEQHLNLLNTQSDYLILPKDTQQHLAHRIEEILNNHGGWIVKPYVTVLLVAQPR